MDFYKRQNQAFKGDFPGNDASNWPLGVGSDDALPNAPDPYSGNGAHRLAIFPGYGVNPARNNGADIEPIPITPVQKQNWPGMQIQLQNGWSLTNFGKKMSYDDYLRLLTSSNEMARSYLSPGKNGIALGNQRIGPSPLNVQAQFQNGPGSQDSNPGGPGQLAAAIGDRRYYG